MSEQKNCCRGPGRGECVDSADKCLYVCPFKMYGSNGLLKGDHIPTVLNYWYHEYDHIISLNKGGEHSLTNIQALCAICHGTKTSFEKLYTNNHLSEDTDAYIIYQSLSKSK